jgi:two-component system, response regulator / RNA-binding antiterminator
MTLKIALVDPQPERAQQLLEVLAAAGFGDVSLAPAGPGLVDRVAALKPDLILMDMGLPDRDSLESVRSIAAASAGPIVMFADAGDPDLVEEAIAAGVISYNLSGVSGREMKAILASAIALYRRHSRVTVELAAAQGALEERRLVERAKASLMAKHRLTEPQAYRQLRTRAMNESRKIADVAAEIAAEAESARMRGKTEP